MFDQLKQKLQRNQPIPEDEVKKHTGMDKAQLNEWSKDRADVGGNQVAGKINMGTAGGQGIPNSLSYTGRGNSAADELKFPPQKKTAPVKDVEGNGE